MRSIIFLTTPPNSPVRQFLRCDNLVNKPVNYMRCYAVSKHSMNSAASVKDAINNRLRTFNRVLSDGDYMGSALHRHGIVLSAPIMFTAFHHVVNSLPHWHIPLIPANKKERLQQFGDMFIVHYSADVARSVAHISFHRMPSAFHFVPVP